ncbi:YcjF family protein [Falsihalocynthiibacter arcticus]|uniref:G domain-containing protein n=1 Tax=Falsihalocynthiibacter arcticus TaxID=1579316 RepID=A0A126V0A3_9RHOB|nr:GTPase [Falsihalocynthiibacter arcticus]AML51733.1 hypothetical protein RC74_11080 [Falsihalocynthiibacter arcticus]
MLNKLFWRSRSQPSDETGEIALPVVWLLGKTGAGKSSLVRALTEQSDVQVGNGFQPCTRSAHSYDYPPEQPLVRFLDTRGLGEAGYDPAQDLEVCRDRSHALIVVCQLNDPVQGTVSDALSDIVRQEKRMRAILVLTGKDLIIDLDARGRAERIITAQMSQAAKYDLPVVTLSLAPSLPKDVEGLDALNQHLLGILPAAGLLLEKNHSRDAEQIEFQNHKRFVLSYAGVAATSDFAPIVGIAAVPATQLKMLHELGRRYGVKWDRKVGAAFLSTMGLSIGARYATSFALREFAKLVPVFGQTVGAATASAISFASTYALGRAAAYFLFRKANGSSPNEDELRKVYQRAFNRSSDEAD